MDRNNTKLIYNNIIICMYYTCIMVTTLIVRNKSATPRSAKYLFRHINTIKKLRVKQITDGGR